MLRPQRRAAAAPAPPRSTPLARAVRGLSPDDTLGRPLPRLTFSRLEATAIARLLPSAQVQVATGFAASREAVTSEALGTADIVHLATHGLVSTEQPSLTGLVVSLLDARGQPRDGFIRLSDVYNLRLTADLVVLSACSTGRVFPGRGEDLAGVAHAFLAAGAQSLVAPLWRIREGATRDWMAAFYRAWATHGSVALATRSAARSTRERWDHPYFWGAFTCHLARI